MELLNLIITEIFVMVYWLLIQRLFDIKLFYYSLSALVLPQTALCPTHLAVWALRCSHSLSLNLLLWTIRLVKVGLTMILVHVLIVILVILLHELCLCEFDREPLCLELLRVLLYNFVHRAVALSGRCAIHLLMREITGCWVTELLLVIIYHDATVIMHVHWLTCPFGKHISASRLLLQHNLLLLWDLLIICHSLILIENLPMCMLKLVVMLLDRERWHIFEVSRVAR